jgi:Flp pilus assembly protein TadG
MRKRDTLQTRRSFATDRSAVAAVEFALLLPLYLFLLLGMTAYGIYFGAAHSVQQLSADAARRAVAGLSPDERQQMARQFIDRNAEGYLFIDPARLTIDVGDSTNDTGQFDVTISYDASDLPIWGLWERLPMPSRIILRRSTIRMGGI